MLTMRCSGPSRLILFLVRCSPGVHAPAAGDRFLDLWIFGSRTQTPSSTHCMRHCFRADCRPPPTHRRTQFAERLSRAARPQAREPERNSASVPLAAATEASSPAEVRGGICPSAGRPFEPACHDKSTNVRAYNRTSSKVRLFFGIIGVNVQLFHSRVKGRAFHS
jgi:hypothetical protein